MSSFFHEINFPPTKVGWVGSGCSPATEPTAELTQFYNITQVATCQKMYVYTSVLISEVFRAVIVCQLVTRVKESTEIQVRISSQARRVTHGPETVYKRDHLTLFYSLIHADTTFSCLQQRF